MSDMRTGEVSAEEFDRRLAAGPPVALDVRLRGQQPSYTFVVSQRTASTSVARRSGLAQVNTEVEALQSA